MQADCPQRERVQIFRILNDCIGSEVEATRAVLGRLGCGAVTITRSPTSKRFFSDGASRGLLHSIRSIATDKI